MSPRSRDWHVSGWPAVVPAPFVFPIALLMQLLPLKKTRDRSASDVAGFLRDFIAGTGGQWDWDDFTSIPITDTALDAIRAEAEMIRLPVDEIGSQKLKELLAKAEKLEFGG
ncbi:MAG TPA: hypothetical protein VLC74_01930 [Rhizomicrobium sp.]|nr:hypothetical protein [Rhizomicrobium sp.]